MLLIGAALMTAAVAMFVVSWGSPRHREVLTRRASAALSSLRQFHDRQLVLQEQYAARHDLSGLETMAAARELRWRGFELAGDVLPEGGHRPGR